MEATAEPIAIDLSRASDQLRSELIFLPEDGRVTRIEGGYRILTPSNPTYWWGNSLRMDRAPVAGDIVLWIRLFQKMIHSLQPASTHMTFGWDGDERGASLPFVAAGFEYQEAIGLAVDRGDPVQAPHRNSDATIVSLDSDDDWASLIAFDVATRDAERHTEAGYRAFVERRVDGWRRLQTNGQGHWFAIRDDTGILSTLGVFAERDRGPDGRRIGRFQHVATHPSARRRGLAGTLVEHASRYAFTELDVDTLYLWADENDDARRVYESCGYQIRSRHRGLERGS